MSKENNIILDFWAPWCVPCKQMKPAVERIASEYADRVEVKAINIEEDTSDISAKYNVRNIPTIVFVKDDKEVERIVGTKTYDFIKTKVEEIF